MLTFDAQHEWLTAYLDGELSPEDRRAAEARLASDADARRMLEELRATVVAVRTLPRGRAPAALADAVRARLERTALLGSSDARGAVAINRWGRRFAYAAVLLMTCGTGYFYFARMNQVEMAARTPPVAGPELVDANRAGLDREIHKKESLELARLGVEVRTAEAKSAAGGDVAGMASQPTALAAAMKSPGSESPSINLGKAGPSGNVEKMGRESDTGQSIDWTGQNTQTLGFGVTQTPALMVADSASLNIRCNDGIAQQNALSEIRREISNRKIQEVSAEKAPQVEACYYMAPAPKSIPSKDNEVQIVVQADAEVIGELVNKFGANDTVNKAAVSCQVQGKSAAGWKDTNSLVNEGAGYGLLQTEQIAMKNAPSNLPMPPVQSGFADNVTQKAAEPPISLAERSANKGAPAELGNEPTAKSPAADADKSELETDRRVAVAAKGEPGTAGRVTDDKRAGGAAESKAAPRGGAKNPGKAGAKSDELAKGAEGAKIQRHSGVEERKDAEKQDSDNLKANRARDENGESAQYRKQGQTQSEAPRTVPAGQSASATKPTDGPVAQQWQARQSEAKEGTNKDGGLNGERFSPANTRTPQNVAPPAQVVMPPTTQSQNANFQQLNAVNRRNRRLIITVQSPPGTTTAPASRNSAP